jgi:hypothetical protein
LVVEIGAGVLPFKNAIYQITGVPIGICGSRYGRRVAAEPATLERMKVMLKGGVLKVGCAEVD